jgi:PIN domain nuclease of toxin-antitoxin system
MTYLLDTHAMLWALIEPARLYHRDPFDRMLIWTAVTQQMTLISKDNSMQLYRPAGLKLAW